MPAALKLDAEVRALLDPAMGRLAAPLRSVAVPAVAPHEQGAGLARAHRAAGIGRPAATFLPRLRANVRVLHAAHRCIAHLARRGHAISHAGEWLLDNIHVLAEQTRAVRNGLPRGYYRGLPVLDDDAAPGLPRVFALAWRFVADNDSAFDATRLASFLQGYQPDAGHALTLGELWALPTSLRVVLIENLRRLAERVAAEEAAREAANALCDHPAGGEGHEAAARFAQMAARGVGAAFALQVMQRLHDDSDTGTPLDRRGREAVRAALAEALPDPDAALLQQQADLAADNHSVAQVVRALQALGSADWRRIVGQASALMQVMQRSPCFEAERDDTQDTSLHAIERLARRSALPEPEVAERLLLLMQGVAMPDACGDEPPVEAPGYWIHGLGRPQLEAALGLQPRGWPAVLGAARRHGLALYLGALALLTLGLAGGFIAVAGLPDASPGLLALCGLLALWPAGEVAAALLHRLCAAAAAPRHAPRLALDQGIPPAQRVLVVVPALLLRAGGAASLVAQLERHHLANREAQAQWALLTDWADADTASQPNDAALLAEAQEAIQTLEQRHRPADAADDVPQRFLLLHRQRCWSETEGRWIGWERKRGKLEQLLALLAEPDRGSPFIDLGACSQPQAGTRHVLTLDSDTVLPPGALRGLVGVAAHPLNRPRIDALRRRVVAGHAILQPRVDVSWPTPEEATPYHRLSTGACGDDPYHAASSEVFNDLFDAASFSGKGLLHVAAVHAVLGGRLPDEQVLSHDLLEGAIARCGGVSDVHLLEPAPSHPDLAAARGHRWTRGDWQLWPLLRQPRRHGLDALHVWKMLDNLRRSLVGAMALLLLGLGLLGLGVAAWPVLGLAALAFGSGPLLAALGALLPRQADLAWGHFLRLGLRELARALAGLAWQLALWPRHVATQLSAIGLALWRSGVSRRHLLQWTTADTARRQAAAGRPWRRHGPMLPAAALGVALLWAAGTPSPTLALLLGLLWAGTPLWVQAAGRAGRSRRRPLGADDRVYLLAVAHDCWRFFEQQVGPRSHHLPPDNVQTVPHTIVAQRTSPTNIGLYLLSVACARAFGWIDTAQMLARCEATLDTLERLPRHRGHLLNWIDTSNLEALPPAYVSTVDSGNLCLHLLAVAGALEDGAVPAPTPAQAARAAVLARRCRALAEAAEFGFLYDARRRLFHIGWRVQEALADTAHYDLLASEARGASLWAIAKGDVPATHWSALGRPFQAAGGQVGLRSWSGSMFEYLMPALVLDEPDGSALARAAGMAVHEQRRFGARHGLPWGVSECARAEIDSSLAYQYGPQGVPRLAMRRTPADERVVAPYATALAALLDPVAAAANLRRLEALGTRSRRGFIEALDYTAERCTDGAPFSAVQTIMAHHQGMSLVALADVLLDSRPRRWTMAQPALAAVACLLHERVPQAVARVMPPPLEGPAATDRLAALALVRAEGPLQPGMTALPPTQLLSNGRYAVSLRANGAGVSRFGAADITRWRDDALRDAHGSFVFLRRGEAAPVSITQHPAPDPRAHYTAAFSAGQAVLNATWPDLRVRCTVWVSPHDDVEFRRIELWNTSARPLALVLMSAFEVCLSEARADEMHPAFANLFVTAHWNAALQALSFSRRPRRDDEAALHAAHFIADADPGVGPARALADRARWRGRLRGAWQPLAAFDPADSLDGPRSTGLDPVAALSVPFTLPPHGTLQLVLGTAAATDAGALQALVQRSRAALPAAQDIAETGIGADERRDLQTLATALLLRLARPTGLDTALPLDRRALWRFGVSGDRPLISVKISHPQGLRLVRVLVRGLAWWARAGLAVDLVVVNAEPRSYQMTLQHELLALQERQRTDAAAATTPAGSGVLYVWPLAELAEAERAGLAMLARVRLHADGRPLAQHVARLVAWHDGALAERDEQPGVALADEPAPATEATPGPLAEAEGAGAAVPPPGRFSAEDGRFSFETTAARPTPRPWVNVLANPDFGALVSESGAGCTWAGNSRLHQLSAWGNDVLADMDGEAFHVQDLRSHQVWQVGRAAAAPQPGCHIDHGPGSTRVQQLLLGADGRDRLALTTTWCVAGDRSIKRVQLQLHNPGPRSLSLRLCGRVEWVLGSLRADRASVRTGFAALRGPGPALDVLLATQLDGHDARAGQTAFFAAHVAGTAGACLDDWTCDRRELYDARGRAVLPDQLGRRDGVGLDPCAAIAVSLRLPPGAVGGCVFVIGHGADRAQALQLAQAEVLQDPARAEQAALTQWRALTGAVVVDTPDPLFNALVNHWLPYQTVACRLWARAGFYQAGGAFGFRDQLQDAMAMTLAAPQLLRAHLLRAAARQFVEGDVQHWWHPATGAGTRTRFSDDRLWLPQALLHYLRHTGDRTVLEEAVPFLAGDAVPAGAEDAYQVPHVAAGPPATLYEHAARALDCSLAVGVHGLPLIGGGDWNDGMNRVGHGGRGESVWLAWFLCPLVAGFVPIARARGELARAARWQAAARGWRQALAGPAWDGHWYRRAFFDDGSPLGSQANAECRIDLLAQAWSVLSGVAPLARQQQAMAAARSLLADEALGLWRLLDPPLVAAQPAAGYIQAYPPGVRENGGQYAHAAAWAGMALARLGDAEGAWRTWTWLSPAHRAADPVRGPLYGLEPYAMAADVYSQPPYAGRGGWSWYTGSAAGLYRLALESVCGLQVAGHRLRLRPRLPGHWPAVTLRLRLQGRLHTLTLCAAWAGEAMAQARRAGALPLAEQQWLDSAAAGDGSHHLLVCRPARPVARPPAAPAGPGETGAAMSASEQNAAR